MLVILNLLWRTALLSLVLQLQFLFFAGLFSAFCGSIHSHMQMQLPTSCEQTKRANTAVHLTVLGDHQDGSIGFISPRLHCHLLRV